MKDIYENLLKLALYEDDTFYLSLRNYGRQIMYDGSKEIYFKEDVDKHWSSLDIGIVELKDFIDWLFYND